MIEEIVVKPADVEFAERLALDGFVESDGVQRIYRFVQTVHQIALPSTEMHTGCAARCELDPILRSADVLNLFDRTVEDATRLEIACSWVPSGQTSKDLVNVGLEFLLCGDAGVQIFRFTFDVENGAVVEVGVDPLWRAGRVEEEVSV